MSIPDEQPTSEEPSPPEEIPSTEAIFPEETVLPEDFTPLGRTSRLPRARRRQAHRMLVPPSAGDRAALLHSLAQRAIPSFEFFLFAIFCGTVLGAAYLLDSPALLLLGLLLAPLLAPWVGLTLSIVTGSWRFFFLTLGGLLVASLLVFLTGGLAGLAGHLWMPLRLFHADIHSHLWWPDLIFVALAAIVLTIAFVRSEQKPVIPSIMLAYGLFLPLSAAGVGWGLGVQPLWPNGALVFLTHLALAILVGVLTLAALRFKPLKASGYLLPILLGLLSLAALVYLTGLTTVIRDTIIATRRSAPTPTTLVLPSMTPAATLTPTATPYPSSTPLPSDTPTAVVTPEPTPVYAVISAPAQYGGAVVRDEPVTGAGIAILDNGTLVQVLPGVKSVNGVIWAHIRMADNVEGWVLQDVLKATSITPTPASALLPTPTP
jgi:MFS family permease